MIIKTATYLMSNESYLKCPDDDKPEIAFIGRSNVGKSSLINMLANNKSLAKTSSSPGKTQKINHFIVNDSWYLVDLPGYGYAKVSKTMREKFSKMINDYVLKRPNLYCLFVLIDSRHPAQQIDLDYMYWLGSNSVPFCIVFTKADKSGAVKLQTNIEDYCKKLSETWDELPPYILTSAEDRRGKEELLDYIGNIVKK
ncbi:MAG: ribosome biogenesis GTP-binding protein YihA/YsxC [Bacteroidales bacterium]|nr:ribosome biogenesis GTP-binding protein YihA/YsxC [Bacteroidales bacterium]